MNSKRPELELLYERLPPDGHRLLYYRLHLLVSRQWHTEWQAKRHLYPHEEADQALRKIEMISFDRKEEGRLTVQSS